MDVGVLLSGFLRVENKVGGAHNSTGTKARIGGV